MILNKNKTVLKLGKDTLIIDRVKVPMYYCQGQEFTEYDIRNLQVEVCRGNIDSEVLNKLEIKDAVGATIQFNPTGTLKNTPHGFDVTSRFALELIKKQREDGKIVENN